MELISVLLISLSVNNQGNYYSLKLLDEDDFIDQPNICRVNT